MSNRQIVITGLGAISPLGIGADSMWQGLLEGKCGIDRIKAFDPAGFTCQIAGETPDFKIRNHVPKSHRKALKLMSRDIELSVIAANEAIADSGFVTKATDPDNINIAPEQMAINIGAGLISCDLVELATPVAKSISAGNFDIRKWGTDGLDFMTPIWLLKYLPNMLACHIGIIHDIRGPSNSITCGEAGAHLAIAEAAQVIARGDAQMAVAGGCEAKVNPLIMLRQCLLKRTADNYNDKPKAACRPFDADASGSVFGEAAGIVVLEDKQNALDRGAKIYAELVGTGSSTDLNAVYENLEPDGKGIEIAIEQALKEANISAADLDLIIPHGTGIPADDLAEAKAIERILGDAVSKVPVWPTKSMLSNTGAASGGLDVIAAASAISEGKFGPAVNCENKAEGCNLNILKEPTEKPLKYVLCCSYTFGGQIAALILKNVEGKN